jgi:hypothetical protein
MRRNSKVVLLVVILVSVLMLTLLGGVSQAQARSTFCLGSFASVV